MSKSNLIKNLAFGLAGLTTLMLVVATAVEKICGATTAFTYIYQAPWMVALWAACAAFSAIYLLMRRKALSLPALGLHAALLLILLGAAITHFCGLQGKLTLKASGEPLSSFTLESGESSPLPFSIALIRSGVDYYPGTSAAMDYASEVKVAPKATGEEASQKPAAEGAQTYRLSMNNILSLQGYRFYQTALGDDYSVLSVAHDPWGIGITYGGYLLLAVSMCSFFFVRKSRFRTLLRSALLPMLLLLAALPASASSEAPATIPSALASRLGKVNVYWGDRVMPLQTMARDFCLKVYGSDTFRGLSAEQVVAGWLFYYDDWKHVPFIKTGGGEVGALIGNTDKYAALTDFFSPSGYKLESAVASDLSDRRLREVDERVAMVTMVCTGSAFKVFPIPESASGSKADAADGRVEWYSFASRPPLQADSQTYIFMSTCLDNITREVYHRQWKNAADELLRLREFQEAHAPAGTIPSERLNALERFYNAAGSPLLPAILCLLLGLWTLSGRLPLAMRIGECALFLWLTFLLALRWIIGGHLPLSNGFETMSAMAWLSLLAAVAASLSRRRLPLLEPAALIVAGLALMVAYMGRSGATVSHLMPVLASPLLSIHVLLVMASYALLAIIAILSAAALWQRCKAASQAASQAAAQCRRLTATSAMLLYPAVFLLAIGIFVGAVWANQSWGRYWGWDPKETWALITLLIYALPLHSASFTRFSTPAPEAPSAPEDTTPEASPSAASAEPSRRRKPTGRLLNIYLLLAFLSVLMTYFGVNYLLSGMHSYA